MTILMGKEIGVDRESQWVRRIKQDRNNVDGEGGGNCGAAIDC